MENNPLEKLVNFSNGITTARSYNGSQLAVMSSLVAVVAWHLSRSIAVSVLQ